MKYKTIYYLSILPVLILGSCADNTSSSINSSESLISSTTSITSSESSSSLTTYTSASTSISEIEYCTVAFNSNGGNSIDDLTVAKGSTIPEPDKPIRENYAFNGWCDDIELTSEYIVFPYTVEDDVTFYADWTLLKDEYKRIDEDGTLNHLGDYILFGQYPQTIMNDDITIDEETTLQLGDYLCYKGSDENWYTKVRANPFYHTGHEFSNGEEIDNYTYYYFLVEPIKWKILSIDEENVATLITTNLIENIPYLEEWNYYIVEGEDGDNIHYNTRTDAYANNYKDSDIRAWLNNNFYNGSFDENQRNIIKTTEIDNSASSTNITPNIFECENTIDKIFLPSYKDLMNEDYGFINNGDNTVSNYKKVNSDLTRAKGIYSCHEEEYYYCGDYWTRSPSGDDSRTINIAGYDGTIYEFCTLSTLYKGVAPMLNIFL